MTRAYITLVPGQMADIINESTGEVLFTSLAVTRRIGRGDARALMKGSRKHALVCADELLDTALAFSKRQGLFLMHVEIIEGV